VQGRFGRFAALADFTAGARVSVPEPEVVRADRRGTAGQVRIVVTLPSSGAARWPQSTRDRAAPELALWAQRALPDPADVAVWFRLPDTGDEAEEFVLRRLAELFGEGAALLDPAVEPAAFGALDLLALCGSGTSGPDPALPVRLGVLASRVAGRAAVADIGRTVHDHSETSRGRRRSTVAAIPVAAHRRRQRAIGA
jgi:hypothetical protein